MIVQCPECQTEFEVADDLMLPDGRKVRCTSCKHVWFQEFISVADEEIASHAIKENADDDSFPSFIDQVEDAAQADEQHLTTDDNKWSDEDEPVSLINRLKNKVSLLTVTVKQPKIIRYSLLALGFLFTATIIHHKTISNKDQMILSNPSSYNIYKYLGHEGIIPAGEGLLFQDTTAEWKSGAQNGGAETQSLILTGKIFNTKDVVQHIPPIKATVLLKSGAKGDSFVKIIDPALLEPQKSVDIIFEISEWPESANDILLNFDIEALN
jgi:predicted Zn finger-like uncharacterized protein